MNAEESAQTRVQQQQAPQECLTCRIIGTGALAGVGIYALQASRPRAPGSVIGKRITAGVGVGKCLVLPYLRLTEVHCTLSIMLQGS